MAEKLYLGFLIYKITYMKASLFSTVLIVLFHLALSAQNDTTGSQGKIGNMPVANFTAANDKGNKMVTAIAPTKAPLSATDQSLFFEILAGGQRQLAISQAVMDKVTDPQVKLLVQSEAQEQTGIASKLQEIATAKGIQPPAAGPDSSIQNVTRKIEGMSGADMNNFYLEQGGIKGHELLLQTMTLVNSTAKDEALKKLSTATLPVIRMHLAVSKEVKNKIGTSGGTASGR